MQANTGFSQLLLCVDPRTSKFYINDVNTGKIATLENVPEDQKARAKKELNYLDNLIYDRNLFKFVDVKGNPIISNNIQEIRFNLDATCLMRYKSRKLPRYLINFDTSDYPRFVSKDDLSIASLIKGLEMVNEGESQIITDIATEVSLSNYSEQISSKSSKTKNMARSNKDYSYKIKLPLINSVNECIKKIIREAYFVFGHVIRKNDDTSFWGLKVGDFAEYLYGDFPLINFYRVQELIRDYETLKVTIVEIPRCATNYKQFPPIYKIPTDRLDREDLESMINWSEVRINPLFFWHAPANLSSKEFINSEISKSGVRTVNKTSLRKTSNDSMFNRPRALIYTTMLEFNERRLELLSKNLLPLVEDSVYSGESDFPFRLKISSVSNMAALFRHKAKHCDYNGFENPDFLTLESAKKNTKKRIGELFKAISNDHSVAKFAAFKKRHESVKMPIQPYLVIVEILLLLGDKLIYEKQETTPVPFSDDPIFNWNLRFDPLRLSQMPLETRIGVNLVCLSTKGERLIIGSATKNLFDGSGRILQGKVGFSLWPFYQIDPRMICMGEYLGMIPKTTEFGIQRVFIEDYCKIWLQFDNYGKDMYYSLRDSRIMKLLGFDSSMFMETDSDSNADNNDMVQINKILARDPTNLNLTDEEKKIIIKSRKDLKLLPSSLTIFLSAINWLNPEHVKIVLQEINEWNLPEQLEEFVILLDVRFHNEYVRKYAVKHMEKMTDKEIDLYMLHFVMALANEAEIHNPLTEFLLTRAVRNYGVVGSQFYWMLRSWYHLRPFNVRISCILEQYMMVCGSVREKFMSQINFNDFLRNLFESLTDPKKAKDGKKEKFINKSLEKFFKDHDKEFSFPHDPRMLSKGFNPTDTTVFSSKKMPILIHTNNSEKNKKGYWGIIKMFDDLKQDILITQIIRLFDNWWLEAGLDLKLTPYKVMATQDMFGYIEFVEDSSTMKDIVEKYSNTLSLSNNQISNYLEDNNSGLRRDIAFENYRRSVAGYSVLTYIMGIGDRHESNYMIKKDGKYFHIDFGHITGHFKTKMGGLLKRERTSLVFTKRLAHPIWPINHPNHHQKTQFYKICDLAINIIRKKSHLLLNLLWMMTSARMPHLKKKDLKWVKDTLHFQGNDNEAWEKLRRTLDDSLNDTMRTFDGWVHRIRHRKFKLLSFSKNKQ